MLPGSVCRVWQGRREGAPEQASLPSERATAAAAAAGACFSTAPMAATRPLLPSRACRSWRDDEEDPWKPDNLSPKAKARPMLPTLLCPESRQSKAKRRGSPPTLNQELLLALEGTPSEPASSSGRGWHSRALIPEHVDCEVSNRYDMDPQAIGRGGHGQVFLATDRIMKGRRVAIKKATVRNGDARAGFEKEVEIMKSLDHPNVCKVFESFDQGRTVYLVMEYLAGGTLLERLWEQDRLGESQCADIVQQVASALKYAHSRGVAHRDLKPENIMFCSKDRSNNHVKVIDWGIASNRFRRMKSVVGTFGYTAPEVMDGGKCYTASCDLWSLGVIMHTMLCGQTPAVCQDPLSENSSIEEENAVSKPSELTDQGSFVLSGEIWDGISSEAKDLVRGLLQTDPIKRYTVDQVLQHPWLQMVEAMATSPSEDDEIKILSNVHRFSKVSSFFSFCANTVAHHLDHDKAEDMRQVFCEMDTNGDGVLQLPELVAGFERVFGPGSAELYNLPQMFDKLDGDGSGVVDFTEFLAAGLGDRLNEEVNALWAAFCSFDVHDPNGKLSREELAQVIMSATKKVRSRESVDRWLDEAFARFDGDGDGELDFDEWRQLLRAVEQHHGTLAITPKVGDTGGAADTALPSAILEPTRGFCDSCRSTCAGETTTASSGMGACGSTGICDWRIQLQDSPLITKLARQGDEETTQSVDTETKESSGDGGLWAYLSYVGGAVVGLSELVGRGGGGAAGTPA